MITREDIEREMLTFPPTLTGRTVRALFARLLAERDAYREVAIKKCFIGLNEETIPDKVDQEAKEILKQNT